MRRILLLLVALAALRAAPAFSVTVDFESLAGSAIPFWVGTEVPDAARLRSLSVPGLGEIRFKTRDGAGYVALITHMGQTGIVAVGKGGKITDSRYLEVSLKKVKGAAFQSVMVLNAGPQFGDDPSTPAVETDFLLGYEGPGVAQYSLRTSRGSVLPPGGGTLTRFSPLPLDLTQIGTPIVSVAIGGSVTIGSLVISPPPPPLSRATATPEASLPALLGAGAAALAWRVRRRRSR